MDLGNIHQISNSSHQPDDELEVLGTAILISTTFYVRGGELYIGSRPVGYTFNGESSLTQNQSALLSLPRLSDSKPVAC